MENTKNIRTLIVEYIKTKFQRFVDSQQIWSRRALTFHPEYNTEGMN